MYVCLICHQKFDDDKEYISHSITDHLKCSYCGVVFESNKVLNIHLNSVHANELKPTLGQQIHDAKPLDLKAEEFKCILCNPKTVFVKMKSVSQHNRDSHPFLTTFFTCPICCREFSTLGPLNQHLVTHLSVKPFICNMCGKDFARKTNLATHMRTHTGEKPLKCDICDKNFANFTNLTAHIRIHSGEKPYKCTYCDRAFGYVTDLRRHKRSHENPEKHIVCKLCDFKCYEQKILRNHINKQHASK